MYREIKDKEIQDSDPEIIAWHRGNEDYLETPLMYIFPQSGDNIKDKKLFVIKDYEKALFYDKGTFIDVLGGGLYKLEKKARIKGTEIVYLDISLIEVPWGIPHAKGVPTKDGYIVGLYGDSKLKIDNVKIFYNDVVAGTKIWKIQDLKDWIISLLHTSLRDIFKNYNAKSIILEDRERVMSLVIAKITEEFLKYGLTLDSFNFIGIKTPIDVEKLFEGEKERKEYLKSQMNNIQQRIKELKDKLNEQQDLLLDDKITQEVYEMKKQQIQSFIREAETEFSLVKDMLDEFSKDESTVDNTNNDLSTKFKVCHYCGKEIEKDSAICSYCGQILNK
jgi:membrane protease subunit (stomatin/prohibitin family)